VHQIRFRPGLCPDPAEELAALPILPSWFKGPTLGWRSKGRGGEREREKEEEGKESKREDFPLRKFQDPPLNRPTQMNNERTNIFQL